MKVHVLSLGCARTLVDSEHLAGLLVAAGHRFTEEINEADCVVVNTCAFIQEAEEESIATILELADLKRSGRVKRLYVAGCLPQKRRGEKENLLALLPEVDGFLGPGDLPKLPELIRGQSPSPARHLSGGGTVPVSERFFVTSPVPTLLFESKSPRLRMTPSHFAYLKVSEGCDHACTFCSIPQFRGAHRCRPIEDLVEEARSLADQGVVELNLIGQDTSYYGADLYGSPRLVDLLTALNGVQGIRWIRLLYAHPAHVTDGLIRALRDLPRVVPYLDIPIQHIADDLLKAMRRETDGRHIRALIEKLRAGVPGIAIRTTFIVGFPGETDAHVEELAQFMEETRFERLGIFPYSPEPKTPAERLPHPVPERVKQERFHRLMVLQQEISEMVNRTWLGREVEVLIEEAGKPSFYLGRTYADAPEVDGLVHVRASQTLRPGQFVRARVTDTTEYDLVAETAALVAA